MFITVSCIIQLAATQNNSLNICVNYLLFKSRQTSYCSRFNGFVLVWVKSLGLHMGANMDLLFVTYLQGEVRCKNKSNNEYTKSKWQNYHYSRYDKSTYYLAKWISKKHLNLHLGLKFKSSLVETIFHFFACVNNLLNWFQADSRPHGDDRSSRIGSLRSNHILWGPIRQNCYPKLGTNFQIQRTRGIQSHGSR